MPCSQSWPTPYWRVPCAPDAAACDPSSPGCSASPAWRRGSRRATDASSASPAPPPSVVLPVRAAELDRIVLKDSQSHRAFANTATCRKAVITTRILQLVGCPPGRHSVKRRPHVLCETIPLPRWRATVRRAGSARPLACSAQALPPAGLCAPWVRTAVARADKPARAAPLTWPWALCVACCGKGFAVTEAGLPRRAFRMPRALPDRSTSCAPSAST